MRLTRTLPKFFSNQCWTLFLPSQTLLFTLSAAIPIKNSSNAPYFTVPATNNITAILTNATSWVGLNETWDNMTVDTYNDIKFGVDIYHLIHLVDHWQSWYPPVHEYVESFNQSSVWRHLKYRKNECQTFNVKYVTQTWHGMTQCWGCQSACWSDTTYYNLTCQCTSFSLKTGNNHPRFQRCFSSDTYCTIQTIKQ